jgi:hypothetical protein
VCADVNGDGSIDIADVTALIDSLLNTGNSNMLNINHPRSDVSMSLGR